MLPARKLLREYLSFWIFAKNLNFARPGKIYSNCSYHVNSLWNDKSYLFRVCSSWRTIFHVWLVKSCSGHLSYSSLKSTFLFIHKYCLDEHCSKRMHCIVRGVHVLYFNDDDDEAVDGGGKWENSFELTLKLENEATRLREIHRMPRALKSNRIKYLPTTLPPSFFYHRPLPSSAFLLYLLSQH